ncbi:MAG: histidine--tRNA ligase [Candidatus Omnitrophica bacterium]|nr:histidine--tRNA ligase [Candidatus Omnitrophota bacterium]
MKYQAIRGMSDIVPPEITQWQALESVTRSFLNKRSYQEVRTPLVEYTELFTRSIGEETDIVFKEMYTFEDRKGRSLTLRPEMTASVVRAVIENNLIAQDDTARFYYIGPMFRAERPQAGRRRQFHQIGVELFGKADFFQDAEVIMLLRDFLLALGLNENEFAININSIGCKTCREPFNAKLTEYLRSKGSELCGDCMRRMQTNMLRVFDCKVEACKTVCAGSPKITDNLCDECNHYFAGLRRQLDDLKIKYAIVPSMVRGLDYYSGPVFEITSSKLGAQDAIAAGGRYDGLVKSCGGPDVGGIGFAIGVERLLQLVGTSLGSGQTDQLIYIAHSDSESSKARALALYAELVKNDINVFIDVAKGSLKSQLRQANKLNARCVLIIGDEELDEGTVSIKDMQSGEQSSVKSADVVNVVKKLIS